MPDNPSAEKTVASTEKRRILTRTGDIITFHPTLAQRPELDAFVAALIAERPNMNYRDVAVPPMAPITRARSRLYAWATKAGEPGAPIGVANPAGVRMDTDGTPLLFKTIARYKVLVTLAVNGPIAPTQLIGATRITMNSYDAFMKQNLIVSWSGNRGATRVLCGINPGLPGYPELVALLRKMHETWPARRYGADGCVQSSAGHLAATKATTSLPFFPSESRADTLLTLFALGGANVKLLHDVIATTSPDHTTRTVRMFEHFGILRHAGNEGTARMYELNKSWVAGPELSALSWRANEARQALCRSRRYRGTHDDSDTTSNARERRETSGEGRQEEKVSQHRVTGRSTGEGGSTAIPGREPKDASPDLFRSTKPHGLLATEAAMLVPQLISTAFPNA